MNITLDSYRGEQFPLIGTVVRGEAIAAADVLAGATTIPLSSSEGYPASGSVDVGGVVIPYTGITGSTLTGCTGVPAIQSGAVVPYIVDLRVGGTELHFLAKRTRGGTSLVTKDTGGNGIVVPGSPPGHSYNIAIESADTDSFTRTEELLWELRLIEPNDDETVIATGVWRVGQSAS